MSSNYDLIPIVLMQKVQLEVGDSEEALLKTVPTELQTTSLSKSSYY